VSNQVKAEDFSSAFFVAKGIEKAYHRYIIVDNLKKEKKKWQRQFFK